MAPDPRHVTAVQKVLYEPRRTRKLVEHLDNIDVLMNLDPGRTLQPGDARIKAGTGPNWFYPSSGKVNGAVLDAANQCDKIAALLADIDRDLARVDFPASDKRHLRAALTAQMQAWRARAKAWRAPGSLNVAATLESMMKPERTSFREFGRVTGYLKSVKHP